MALKGLNEIFRFPSKIVAEMSYLLILWSKPFELLGIISAGSDMVWTHYNFLGKIGVRYFSNQKNSSVQF